MIRAVSVVIPVHDEEELLGECLASVTVAREHLRTTHPDVTCRVWVVLDACRDASDAVAEAADVRILRIEARNVGAARAAGLDAARARFAHVPPHDLWTAHTDADSAVPAHWLSHQVTLAEDGADVVVGTVRPDFRDLDAQRTAAWWARYSPGVANGHVHGANLGIRAAVLDEVGGFDHVTEHEDVRLVDAARAVGATVVATDGAWVRTSARQQGRTPGGYARYLREDLIAGLG
jgi:glycosyltransferase involved in cell wall biosynthesis